MATHLNTPILEKLLGPQTLFREAAQNCSASLIDRGLVVRPMDEANLFAPLSPKSAPSRQKFAPCPKRILRPAWPTPTGTHLSGPISALKYPSVHQVGKSDRAGAKKSALENLHTIARSSARSPSESDRRGLLRRCGSDGGLGWVTVANRGYPYMRQNLAKNSQKIFTELDTGMVRAPPGAS